MITQVQVPCLLGHVAVICFVPGNKSDYYYRHGSDTARVRSRSINVEDPFW